MNITSKNNTYNTNGLKIIQNIDHVIIFDIKYYYPEDIKNTDVTIDKDKIYIGNYELDYKNNQWIKNTEVNLVPVVLILLIYFIYQMCNL